MSAETLGTSGALSMEACDKEDENRMSGCEDTGKQSLTQQNSDTPGHACKPNDLQQTSTTTQMRRHKQLQSH
jgi:hypothetical protein